MSTLPERLRQQYPETPHHRDALHREAADEIERLQADALRYRWLRSFRPSPLGNMDAARQLGLDLRQTYISTPEKLDAAIDAAMAASASEAERA